MTPPEVIDSAHASLRLVTCAPSTPVLLFQRSQMCRCDPLIMLAWAPQEAPLEEWVCRHARRHQIEQMLEHGKGEAGLDHYEVRSYVGWHHHMTLSLLALWFLSLERLAMGKKDASGDGAAGAGDLLAAIASSASRSAADRPRGQHCAGSQRTSENLPLARPHRSVPATASSRRFRINRLQ